MKQGIHLVALILFATVVVLPADDVPVFTDNFDDNSRDTSKWGIDFDYDGPGGFFTETSQRLEYTSSGFGHVRVRPWVMQQLPYAQDWEVIAQVNNTMTSASTTEQGLGLAIQNTANPGFVTSVEIHANDSGLEQFYSSILENGVDVPGAERGTADLDVSSGMIRITFDSTTKVMRLFYMISGTWIDLASYGISGSGGTTADFDWGMSGSATFKVGVIGYAEGGSVSSGQIYLDNFQIALNTQAAPYQVPTLITFEALGAKTFGDAGFELGATSNAGLPVTYTSSNIGVATVSGFPLTIVTIVGAGSTTITASQGGDVGYEAAPSVAQTLTVSRRGQTITFLGVPAKLVGDAAFALGAMASSGLPVTYSSSNTGVATVSGSTVTIVGAGSTTITAQQAGDTNHLGAVNVAQQLTVNKQTQAITLAALDKRLPTAGSFTLSGVSDSGLTLTYTSSDTGIATISGHVVTLTGAEGMTTITANQAGDATFAAAAPVAQVLTVSASSPALTAQPQSETNCVGTNVFFTITASGQGAPFNYQWRSNGVDIAGATMGTLSLLNIQPSFAADYSVNVSNSTNAVTSAAAKLTVLVPATITIQPPGSTNNPGDNVTLSVTAEGSNLTYRWHRAGQAIAGATSASYSINNIQQSDAGGYTVTVSNACGSVPSAVAQVNVNGPLVINDQPLSQTPKRGDAVTLLVSVGGTQPITHHWRRNGVNLVDAGRISGATTATLTIANIQTNDNGSYDYVGSNVVGTATSTVAKLTVRVPVVITQQPLSQTVLTSNQVSFSVTLDAETTAPVTYQWRKDGVDLAGATGSSYTIGVATTNEVGAYQVVMNNVCGSVSSAMAFLGIVDRSVLVGGVQVLTTNLPATVDVPIWLVGDGTENRVSFTVSYPTNNLISLTGGGAVTVHPTGVAMNVLTVDSVAGTVQVDLQLTNGATFATGSNGLVTLSFTPGTVTNSTILPLILGGNPQTNLVYNATNGLLPSDFQGGGVSFRKPFRTDKPVYELVNPNTGTLQEELTVPAPAALPAGSFVRVLIFDLGVDSLGNPIRVLNAAGTTASGIPYVIFPGTVTAGQTLTLELEYYVSDRTTVPTPRFEVDTVTSTLPVPVGTAVASATRTGLAGGAGDFILEFNTSAGASYYVQYGSNVAGPYATSFPAVIGTGSRVQWGDNGPPRTSSKPMTGTVRFYKVIQAP